MGHGCSCLEIALVCSFSFYSNVFRFSNRSSS
uniref:Uncharacterized protein n=1 Tax=Rhizophora mucronata TaxID=61149 RepID=A0A2P2N5R7_RHIMU